MSVFDQLLRVQGHDTAADRLRHRRATLPELAELAAVEKSLAEVDSALADASGRLSTVAGEQRRLEDELAATEGRITDLERRLYSGVVTVPRELQAMQADLESLRRRRSTLEDEVLDTMANREPVDAEVARLEAEQARLFGEAARLGAAATDAQAEIDAELAREVVGRAEAAEGLPADLLSLYERLRARHGGVGAAPLIGARCGGCHLTLPATETDRIRREPPDALVTCDQCGRILVRS